MRSRTGSPTRLLLLERDPAQCQAMEAELHTCLGADALVMTATSGHDATGFLRASSFDIVIVDLNSASDISQSVDAAMTRLCRLAGNALVVALSEGETVSCAVSAMQAGAHDHISKPFCGTAFSTQLDDLARRHGKASVICTGADRTPTIKSDAGVHCASNQMQLVYEQIERIAASPAPVFITGERGTGKKLCAETLHDVSPRKNATFVTVNCHSRDDRDLESTLFGHIGIEDTSAFERADGGTLVIDEIGALSLALQSKVLRFLQTGTVTRLGEGLARPVDIRIVCTTRHNPMQLIAAQKLREDLFYRLNVLPIHVAPLRHRPADILPLARHFLSSFAVAAQKPFQGLNESADDFLVAREWPGNVRQLSDLMQSVTTLFDGGVVSAAMLCAADTALMDHPRRYSADRETKRQILPMWQQEQKIIEDTISYFSGNISKAAAALEISPSTIYRKRQSWIEMASPLAGVA